MRTDKVVQFVLLDVHRARQSGKARDERGRSAFVFWHCVLRQAEATNLPSQLLRQMTHTHIRLAAPEEISRAFIEPEPTIVPPSSRFPHFFFIYQYARARAWYVVDQGSEWVDLERCADH